VRPPPDPVQPGQESVWSYPRPPRLERANAHLKVVLGGVTIAETNDALRVLETVEKLKIVDDGLAVLRD